MIITMNKLDKQDISMLYEAYLVEARRLPEEPVIGIKRLLDWIEMAKEGEVTPEFLNDLADIIYKSKCPKIQFEVLSGALGISTPYACSVSSIVLQSSITKMVYVILHELAHQYQYTKHGEQFAHDIYFKPNSILQATKELLKIEQIADRFAIAATKKLLTKHNIPVAKLYGFYLQLSPESLVPHIRALRKQISDLGITSIDEINEVIYNSIKVQISKNKPQDIK